MPPSTTGLLLITQMRTILTNCVDVLIKSTLPHVDRKLYIALHRNVASKMNENQSETFDFITNVYRTASVVCQPNLDVRILLENLKEDFLSTSAADRSAAAAGGKPNILQRVYREVDCIFLDHQIDTADSNSTINLNEILKDFQTPGSKQPKLIKLDICSSNDSLKKFPTFVQDDGCRWDASLCKYSGSVLGGTFDRIHNGHKILLSTAILLAKNKVTCGVTDGVMLKNKVLNELILPIEERIRNVSDFISDVDSSVEMKIVPIEDPFGPSIVDTDLKCIVASKETKTGAFKVNEKRVEKGLNKLDVFICNLVEDQINDMCPKPETKVSSSKMRQQLLGELLRIPKSTPRIAQSPYIIGLTGGIASGKSNIAKYLQQVLGAFVIDCDQLGHKAYSPGTPTYDKVVSTFGREVVDEANNGAINRKVLGEKVFSNKAELQKLNEIVWPEIMRMAQDMIKQAANEKVKVVVLDAAVLFEAGWQQDVHEIWTTFVPTEEAIKRLETRNKLTEIQAKQRLEAQPLTNKERIDRSNVVFCSLWDYHVTRAQVKKAWTNLMDRLK